MDRILAAVSAVVLCGTFSGCQFIPGMGGGGAPLPTEVPNSMYAGDLADAKDGRWMSYGMESSGFKSTTTVKVDGRDGDGTWIEWWTEAGGTSTGYLFVVGGDKKIAKAWAAHKDDKEWTSIKVSEPPKGQAGDAPKPTIKESDEKKDVKAGSFSCRKLDVTSTVGGKDYTSQTWYSKDAWKLHSGTEHGGLVAMEASGMKTWLDAKGEDGKPSIELPKK